MSVRSWLITGGCGFIGSHLADAVVAGGDRVRILDDLSSGKVENAPAGAELIRGDVADAAVVEGAMDGVAGCFHLAAIASVERCNEDWIGAHRVNVGGLINVLSAARRRATPVVYASSAAVYGASRDLPLEEKSATSPLSPYAVDKFSCELHARVAGRIFGVPSAGLRLFNVYGARQDPASRYAGVISIFLERILHGEALAIHGDGKQTRDFIHVADVVRAFQAAMGIVDLSGDVYNVCTGRAASLLDLAAVLGKVAGRPVRFVWEPPRQGDVAASVGDPMLLLRRTGLSAKVSLEAGLADLASHVGSLAVADVRSDPAP
jgi:UDP-glucose 4-epimerase